MLQVYKCRPPYTTYVHVHVHMYTYTIREYAGGQWRSQAQVATMYKICTEYCTPEKKKKYYEMQCAHHTRRRKLLVMIQKLVRSSARK